MWTWAGHASRLLPLSLVAAEKRDLSFTLCWHLKLYDLAQRGAYDPGKPLVLSRGCQITCQDVPAGVCRGQEGAHGPHP